MRVGIPREIKTREYRVGMVPAGVEVLKRAGHTVLVERDAGLGAGLSNESYVEAGATLCDTAAEIWAGADMIVKVKEPLPPEYGLLRSGQALFTYLHLAAVPELAKNLLEKSITAVGYETIERIGDTGPHRLPLLQPMSAIAGRMSVQVGASLLEKAHGGKGILLGGMPGVRRGRVIILGAGVVGQNAARIAVGLGAMVKVLDINIEAMRLLEEAHNGNVHTLFSNPQNIREAVETADLVIGAVLVTGAKAPKLVTAAMIKGMEAGSVVVDVSIDQGGCIETARPTTHDQPTFVVDDVIHYGVANMPGAVSRTSTFALANATLPYALRLANHGVEKAVAKDSGLALGINTYAGKCTHPAVAASLNLPYEPLPFM